MTNIYKDLKDLKGKELFKFLIDNKKDIINEKKKVIKFTDTVSCVPEKYFWSKSTNKALPDEIMDDVEPGTLLVKVIGNACWWFDSDYDVLIDDSSKKTIEQRKFMIPHLHDHVHKLEAQLGDVLDVYLENIAIRKLGFNKSGSTQCIVMETKLIREYNPKVFDLYKANKVNQHSIALQYVDLEIAINDEESEKEYDFWKKYFKKIINQDIVEEKGFFFVVKEIKLMENSAVLFGSNELTPTLETRSHSLQTAKEAPVIEPDEEFDLDAAIMTTKFLTN